MADSYVVDTGVFLRWFVVQDGFEHAQELQQELVDGSITVATIDIARVEVAGVLRKKGLLAGRLTPEEFAGAVRVIDDIGVTDYETTADRLEQAALLSARREAWAWFFLLVFGGGLSGPGVRPCRRQQCCGTVTIRAGHAARRAANGSCSM